MIYFGFAELIKINFSSLFFFFLNVASRTIQITHAFCLCYTSTGDLWFQFPINIDKCIAHVGSLGALSSRGCGAGSLYFALWTSFSNSDTDSGMVRLARWCDLTHVCPAQAQCDWWGHGHMVVNWGPSNSEGGGGGPWVWGIPHLLDPWTSKCSLFSS